MKNINKSWSLGTIVKMYLLVYLVFPLCIFFEKSYFCFMCKRMFPVYGKGHCAHVVPKKTIEGIGFFETGLKEGCEMQS